MQFHSFAEGYFIIIPHINVIASETTNDSQQSRYMLCFFSMTFCTIPILSEQPTAVFIYCFIISSCFIPAWKCY